jgi:GH15 family glucan-1,4-alpha-glucosidase
MDLALIGNCSFQALIDTRARVRWLCWPRFDSSFVFGSLLDEERGGAFEIVPATEVLESEQEYLPNTNVLRTRFHCDDGVFDVIDFAPRFIQYERSFKPTMLVRIIRPVEGKPRVAVRCEPVYRYGDLVPRSHIASNHIQWEVPEASLRLTTDVARAYIDESRPFVLEETAYVVLTWGEPLEAPLAETCESFLGRTRRYWEKWVKHCALPTRFQSRVIRSALTLKLHQFEDTGAITAATTTSIPEYPGSGRTWDYRYCWLRDAYFTLMAMRRLNHFEEMEGFVRYLANLAATSDRLQPVYGISGESELTERIHERLAGYDGEGPVRIGNAAYEQVQNDVYGEMLAAIAPLFLDLRFVGQRTYGSDLVDDLLSRIEETMELPDAGLWEIRDEPKVHTFSLLMHWFGARVGMHVGQAIHDEALVDKAKALEKRARALLDGECYRAEDGYFADATTTDNADAALLMMINLGFLGKDDPRASSHLQVLAERLRIEGSLFHRYVHHDGIGDTHATFTVCSFWYAEALARMGRYDEAEKSLAELCELANHVGLFSEDIDPATRGQLGNFPQTYSHVGLINAAFAVSRQDADNFSPMG